METIYLEMSSLSIEFSSLERRRGVCAAGGRPLRTCSIAGACRQRIAGERTGVTPAVDGETGSPTVLIGEGDGPLPGGMADLAGGACRAGPRSVE